MSADTTRHRATPWRVHTLAPDFELLDVWHVPIDADPAQGETFDRFFEVAWANGIRVDALPSRFLYWLRALTGRLLRWDQSLPIPGCREHSVTERLTDDDRRRDLAGGDRWMQTPAGERVRLVYRYEDEALIEVSNATIAALFHLGWVDLRPGRKTVEAAIYIKSRGPLSRLYMALIMPFRHVIVYPTWTAHMARLWRDRRAPLTATAR